MSWIANETFTGLLRFHSVQKR